MMQLWKQGFGKCWCAHGIFQWCDEGNKLPKAFPTCENSIAVLVSSFPHIQLLPPEPFNIYAVKFRVPPTRPISHILLIVLKTHSKVQQLLLESYLSEISTEEDVFNLKPISFILTQLFFPHNVSFAYILTVCLLFCPVQL